VTKRLLRGRSVQVDTVLDWMELGCFDALERRYVSVDIYKE
jgi:hypothetical protein